MITKDLNTKSVVSGFSPAQCTTWKPQFPPSADASHFRQLTKAETSKHRTECQTECVDYGEMALAEHCETTGLEAGQSGPVLQPNSMTFTPQVFYKITQACAEKSQLSLKYGAHPGQLLSSEQKPGYQFERPQIRMNVEQNPGFKPALNIHHGRNNAYFNAQPAATKNISDMPVSNVVETTKDIALLLQLLVVQTPLMTSEAQIISLRTTHSAQVASVQIEQIKRSSAGVLTSLELVLEPAELGRITARLHHEEGRVTLILSAEHRHVADDLARDGGLLLRVLAEHLPNIDRMSVFIQTDASQTAAGRGQMFFEMGARQNNGKERGGIFANTQFEANEVKSDVPPDGVSTTSSGVFV